MTNGLEIFKNEEFGTVRTLTINDEPWFVGKDVATILGYAKPENAIANHVDSEDKTTTLIQGTGSNYKSNTVIINESGLYSLILSSKLPNARKFKHWVTSEVIPAIRKHGIYSLDNRKASLLLQIYDGGQNAVVASKQLAELEVEEATAPLVQKIEEDKPYSDFGRHVSESSDTVDIGEFAKMVNKENINVGRNRLFKWLRENGYLMSDNTPYQKYINNDYFDVIEVVKRTAYGTNIYPKTLVTGKGQIALVERLREDFGENK